VCVFGCTNSSSLAATKGTKKESIWMHLTSARILEFDDFSHLYSDLFQHIDLYTYINS
jgi:hypothetical protein